MWVRIVGGAASLLLPGLGQLLRRQIVEGLLFLWAAFWVHTLLSGIAQTFAKGGHDLLDSWLFGAIGTPKGAGSPALVVFTIVALALHFWALAHVCRRHPQGEQEGGRAR